MAEDDEAAGAAERLEQALARIAKATSQRQHETQLVQSRVDTVAERLDLMIAELRAVLLSGGPSSH
jgi:hypothetical protein